MSGCIHNDGQGVWCQACVDQTVAALSTAYQRVRNERDTARIDISVIARTDWEGDESDELEFCKDLARRYENVVQRDDRGDRECFRKDCGGHVAVVTEGSGGRSMISVPSHFDFVRPKGWGPKEGEVFWVRLRDRYDYSRDERWDCPALATTDGFTFLAEWCLPARPTESCYEPFPMDPTEQEAWKARCPETCYVSTVNDVA